jgi:hypothetical protein
MCSILKKLTRKLQPHREVALVIDDVLKSKKGNNCRIVEHLLSFAEHQFGKGVRGKRYREREDGERISNWKAEIFFLHRINQTLSKIHGRDNLLSTIIRDDVRFPYLEQSLSPLNPWMINLDSDASDRIYSLNEDHLSYLVKHLCLTEQNMAIIAMNRRQFDLAEGHCQQCLVYSRRYGLEVEEKITKIFVALNIYCSLQERQGYYSGALSSATTWSWKLMTLCIPKCRKLLGY